MSRERRLGRGLEALLSQPLATEEPSGNPLVAAQSNAIGGKEPQGILWTNVYEIDRNPFQPRKHFADEEIQSLSESIIEHGMLQPVVVRPHGDRYQLISGERRWRAATVAGWEKVPTQVREADDRQMAELAIVENVQRKDLDPLEKAASFQHYLEQYGCTQEELAGRVKVDRSTISNLIRLLELPETVQDAIRSGAITQGHARALLPLGEEREQNAFCQRIQQENLSVRATERLIHDLIRDAEDGEPSLVVVGKESLSSPTRTRSEHLSALEQEFRSALGTKVVIRDGAKGRGQIVVHFTSHEEFNRIHSEITGSGIGAGKSRAG